MLWEKGLVSLRQVPRVNGESPVVCGQDRGKLYLQ